MTTATDVNKHFHEILEDFDSAMLVTQTPAGQLRARPMALAHIDENNDIWFCSQSFAGKVDEVQNDSQVCVTLQSATKYLSLSGKAEVRADRAKIEEFWTESWKVWFPGGKDDPSLILIRVAADVGEYWDNSGSKGIGYLIEAGKAYLKGERPDVETPERHAKTKL
jgi:general stress protein 26